MFKVGLTGGIGSGKSSAVRYFQSLGIKVLDADQIARQIVQAGQPALQQIKQEFGESALDESGALNRSWMREQIFTEPESKDRLEAITHPLIRQRIIQAMAEPHVTDYLIVDIPLLIEKAYQSLFDAVLVVDCLPEQQIKRVQQRDGSDIALIKGIMKAQASRGERQQSATHVLDNSDTLVHLHQQIDRLHQAFLKLAGSAVR
ncbi:MAG: Dephospho-CoA kinase (EC [uncultured Thiotrichaceae bacterium]|uniref:Dephospho-CoA kinase n=1 Tax=uncultured Thiotrichaceae bacterium TaxID=298394 RepID=A0A6S6U2F6_9GAMM|nr:MAG: Dephospho-CoA kinase (EC [uncultured Thiotrichaceae bacterium]